jgi:hypothetical protein
MSSSDGEIRTRDSARLDYVAELTVHIELLFVTGTTFFPRLTQYFCAKDPLRAGPTQVDIDCFPGNYADETKVPLVLATILPAM